MGTYTPDSSKVVHSTKVDFITRPMTNPIHLVQYDDTLPIIEVTLYSNGQLYTIPSTADVNVRFGKGDGTMVYNPVLGWDSNRHIVYIEVTQQMTAVKGTFNPVVEIIYDDGVVNSGYLNVIIDRNPIQEGDIESTDEYRTIQHIADDTIDAVNEILSQIIPTYKGNYSATTTYAVNDVVQYNDAVYYHVGTSETTGTAPTDTTVWKLILPGTAVDTTLTQEGVAADSKAVGDIKADKDGYYENLSVGRADNIISDVSVTDTTPYGYGFRTSGGSLDIGDTVKLKEIIGVSPRLYQRDTLVSSSSTSTNGWIRANSTNSGLTLSGRTYTFSSKTNSSVTKNVRSVNTWVYKDHVMYVCADMSVSDSSTTGYLGAGTNDAGGNKQNFITLTGPTDGFVHMATIKKATYQDTTSQKFFIRLNNGAPNESYVKVRELQVIDLTCALGEEVADYLASIETDNPGSGVALFRSIFPYKYYPGTTSITFRATQTDKKICVGFNAYNPTENIAKVVPNQEYTIEGNYTSYTYTPLGSTVVTTVLSTDLNASSPTFDFAGELSFTGADSDLCVHLKYDGTRDGEKEQYRAHEYKFEDNLRLRGVFKLDSNNNIYAYGDTYTPAGVVTKRFDTCTVNSLDWSLDSGTGLFYASVPNMKLGGKVILTQTWIQHHGSSSYTTVEEMLAGIGTQIFLYELAEPVVESAASYLETQVVDSWGTEEFVDYAMAHGTQTLGTPYGHVSSYPQNLKAKIESAPNNPATDGDYILKRENGVNRYVPVSSNVFVITITQNGYDFTSDATYQEILDAYYGGKRLILFVDNITSDGENFVSGYAELSGYIPSITNFNPSFKFVVYFEEYYIAYVVSISLDTNDDTIVSIYGASI